MQEGQASRLGLTLRRLSRWRSTINTRPNAFLRLNFGWLQWTRLRPDTYSIGPHAFEIFMAHQKPYGMVIIYVYLDLMYI